MSVTFINYTNQYSTNASFTASTPTNTADGDVMFAIINGSSYSGTPAAGWTKIAEDFDGNNNRVQLFYKIASSEGATSTWAGFNGVNYTDITIATYRISNLSGPIINAYSNTAYTTTNTTCRGGSITTTRNSVLFFIGTVAINSVTAFTKPTVPSSDWVEDFDIWDASYDTCNTICHMIWNSIGTTGDIDATLSQSLTTKHAFVVALSIATNFSETQSENLALSDVSNSNYGLSAHQTDSILVSESNNNSKGIISNEEKHDAVITNQPKS